MDIFRHCSAYDDERGNHSGISLEDNIKLQYDEEGPGEAAAALLREQPGERGQLRGAGAGGRRGADCAGELPGGGQRGVPPAAQRGQACVRDAEQHRGDGVLRAAHEEDLRVPPQKASGDGQLHHQGHGGQDHQADPLRLPQDLPGLPGALGGQVRLPGRPRRTCRGTAGHRRTGTLRGVYRRQRLLPDHPQEESGNGLVRVQGTAALHPRVHPRQDRDDRQGQGHGQRPGHGQTDPRPPAGRRLPGGPPQGPPPRNPVRKVKNRPLLRELLQAQGGPVMLINKVQPHQHQQGLTAPITKGPTAPYNQRVYHTGIHRGPPHRYSSYINSLEFHGVLPLRQEAAGRERERGGGGGGRQDPGLPGGQDEEFAVVEDGAQDQEHNPHSQRRSIFSVAAIDPPDLHHPTTSARAQGAQDQCRILMLLCLLLARRAAVELWPGREQSCPIGESWSYRSSLVSRWEDHFLNWGSSNLLLLRKSMPPPTTSWSMVLPLTWALWRWWPTLPLQGSSLRSQLRQNQFLRAMIPSSSLVSTFTIRQIQLILFSMYFIHFLSPSSSTFPSSRCSNRSSRSSSSPSRSWSPSFRCAAWSSLFIARLKSLLCCFSFSIISFLKLEASASLSLSFLALSSGECDRGDHSGLAEMLREVVGGSILTLLISSSMSWSRFRRLSIASWEDSSISRLCLSELQSCSLSFQISSDIFLFLRERSSCSSFNFGRLFSFMVAMSPLSSDDRRFSPLFTPSISLIRFLSSSASECPFADFVRISEAKSAFTCAISSSAFDSPTSSAASLLPSSPVFSPSTPMLPSASPTLASSSRTSSASCLCSFS